MPASPEHGLRHALTTAQLTMIAIGGAIGTGLFLGSGFAIRLAGPGVLASYAIGALIALLLMGSLAEMSAADPAPGSFGLYAERYLSPFAGFIVRYSYWACVVLAVGTEVSAVAVYMHYWLSNVPGWVWVFAFSAALIAINALQVGAFGAVEYTFSLIKVIAICGFILLGGYLVLRSPHNASANLFSHGGFLPHGASGAWQAVDVAIFSYFSLEMVAVAAGEARDPRTAVVRAFRGTVVRLILFYLGTLAITLALVPWTATAAGSSSPFVLVMQSTAIPYAAGILNLVVLIAALSAMNSQLYITSRMMFSLARAGYAPSGLGKLTSASVPVPALLLSSLGIGVAFLLQAFAPAKAFGIMLAVSTFGAMFTWMMIFVTHLNFRRGFRGALPFRLALYPATPLLGALFMLALIVTTAFVPGFELTLVFGIPFLLLLTIIYFAFFRSRTIAAETTAL